MTADPRVVLAEALRRAAEPVVDDVPDIPLVPPAQPEHGDLATPVAMALAKRAARAPREIAEEVSARLRSDSAIAGWIAEAEIAGANCTQEQLDRLSPVTQNLAPDPGTELATSEDVGAGVTAGEPRCDAPYEYYSSLEYIRKAREEVGYSDYEAAVEYAQKSPLPKPEDALNDVFVS